MTTTKPRRTGGRAARRALRAAPLETAKRPVQGGLSGGTLQVLSRPDLEAIHRAALHALEHIGLADAPRSGIDAMCAAGARLGDDARLRFPAALIEDMLARPRKDLVLHGRDRCNDLEPGGQRVYYGTGGAAVHVVDVEAGTYRESTAQDLQDAARIADTLDNIHFFQRPMVARDIIDNFEMDLNTVYACCSGTTKHIGTSISEPGFAPGIVSFLHMVAGSEDKWRARPFVSCSNCFVVPPMKFATESCETLEYCVRAGMPVLLLSAGQAGATAPASLAGAIVQAVAECLAGVFYIDAISPGHPFIFGTWPFVSDLRTGAMSGGSGEQALLNAGCAQMHQFYGFPGSAAAGFSDAKLPDMQAGWEQATSAVMAGLAGLNMVYEAAGMHASLLGFCHESLILADDMIGQTLRCVRGIEVNDETLALDALAEVCLHGPGHYLGQAQTLELMETEYVYPQFADRSSPREWDENGRPDLIARASLRKRKILAEPSAAQFDPALDGALRDRFPIRLPP